MLRQQVLPPEPQEAAFLPSKTLCPRSRRAEAGSHNSIPRARLMSAKPEPPTNVQRMNTSLTSPKIPVLATDDGVHRGLQRRHLSAEKTAARSERTWPGTQATSRGPVSILTLKMPTQLDCHSTPYSQADCPPAPKGVPCSVPQALDTCSGPPSHTDVYQAVSSKEPGHVPEFKGGEATERKCFLPRVDVPPPLQAEVQPPQHDPEHRHQLISAASWASATPPHWPGALEKEGHRRCQVPPA